VGFSVITSLQIYYVSRLMKEFFFKSYNKMAKLCTQLGKKADCLTYGLCAHGRPRPVSSNGGISSTNCVDDDNDGLYYRAPKSWREAS